MQIGDKVTASVLINNRNEDGKLIGLKPEIIAGEIIGVWKDRLWLLTPPAEDGFEFGTATILKSDVSSDA